MVAGVFFSKSIPIKYFDTRQVGIRYLNVLMKYARLMKADYLRTTETWEKHHPRFSDRVFFAGGNAELFVMTTDPVYTEIDEGADMYVAMTPDWIPKTQPGVLRSFKGQGGVARKTKTPRELRARRFSDTITRKYEKQMISELFRATREGVEARRKRPT